MEFIEFMAFLALIPISIAVTVGAWLLVVVGSTCLYRELKERFISWRDKRRRKKFIREMWEERDKNKRYDD